jgi:hypothetical protein
MDTGIAVPLDLIVPLTLSQLEKLALPDVPVTTERVDLDAVEAEMIRYVGELSTAVGEDLPMSFAQLVVPVGITLYVVSLGAPLDLAADYEDLLRQIGLSFRLLE